MKKSLLFIFLLAQTTLFAQTNLFTNGSFENATSPWTGWSFSAPNGDLWAGQGSCGASAGTDYAWAGDQTETNGVNDLSENMYQQVTVPSNSSYVVLNFDASINTQETGSTAYDEMEIIIQNSSGTFLESLGTLDNTSGDSGFGSCQTWAGYYAVIPSNYYGQTIRVVFQFTTDGSLPTIFRVDDVEFLVTTAGCTYSLSTNTYNLSSAASGTFSNVASVTAPTGCAWNASVTSGNGWLSTSSSGSGNGNVSISVAENTSLSSRTGTISVGGQTLTVLQPGVSCDYSLTQSTYNCPDYKAANLVNIALVNVSNGCSWDATVIEGTTWMVCNSNGSGNGTINIDVTANNTGQDRSGVIVVESETLLVVQPRDFKLTGIPSTSEQSISVFPNPANDFVTIQSSSNYIGGDYIVTDWTGRILMIGKITETNQNIALSAIPSGAYFITIKSDDGSFSEKIIKL